MSIMTTKEIRYTINVIKSGEPRRSDIMCNIIDLIDNYCELVYATPEVPFGNYNATPECVICPYCPYCRYSMLEYLI